MEQESQGICFLLFYSFKLLEFFWISSRKLSIKICSPCSWLYLRSCFFDRDYIPQFSLELDVATFATECEQKYEPLSGQGFAHTEGQFTLILSPSTSGTVDMTLEPQSLRC